MSKPTTQKVFYVLTLLYGGTTTATAFADIDTDLRGRALYKEIRDVHFKAVHPDVPAMAVTTFYYIEEL